MSQRADCRDTGDGSDDETDDSPATLIELLGDAHAREILAALREGAKSARALSKECDTSRPTVYRRLERLQAAGLVTESMEYDGNGHHRRTFAVAVQTVGFELGTEGFEASVEPTESAASSREYP